MWTFLLWRPKASSTFMFTIHESPCGLFYDKSTILAIMEGCPPPSFFVNNSSHKRNFEQSYTCYM